MPSYLYAYNETKKMVNGNIVENKAVKSEYDGKTLHVDKIDNEKFTHNVIQDKDLHKLLKKGTSKWGLLEKLSKEYTKKKRTRRKQQKNTRHKHRKHV